jgi:hypothetical protein
MRLELSALPFAVPRGRLVAWTRTGTWWPRRRHTDFDVNPDGVDSADAESLLNAVTLMGVPPGREDAAHAMGSSRPAGSLARLAAFSLYPTKVATSGERGLIACAQTGDAGQHICLPSAVQRHDRAVAGDRRPHAAHRVRMTSAVTTNV